jgi:hypothetical protein
MATNEEVILLKFQTDVTNLKSGLSESNNLLSEQGEVLDKNGKKITAMGNTFSKTGEQIKTATFNSSAGMQALNAQTEQVGQTIKKAFADNSIKGLNERLSETKKQLESVSTTGKLFKALTEEAKKLDTEIKIITGNAPSLKQQYQEALKNVSLGVKGAAEEAGRLKDELDDAKEAVANLATGSKLEAFNSQLGTTVGKLANLDFGGAADAAKQLQTISSSISFKEVIGQSKDLLSSLGNLGASVLTNPFFLAAGTLAAISFGIYKIITAEDEEVTRLKEINLLNQARFNLIEKGLDREILLAQAAGKDTTELEKQKLKVTIDRVQSQLNVEEKLFAVQRDRAIAAISYLKGRAEAVKLVSAAEASGEGEAFKKIKDLRDSLDQAKNAFDANEISSTKKKTDDAIAKEKEYTDAAKAEAEKRKAEREKQQARYDKIAKDEANEEIAQLKRVDEEVAKLKNKDNGNVLPPLLGEDILPDATVEDVESNLKFILDATQKNNDARLQSLNTYLEEGKITQEQYNEELDKMRDEQLQKDLDSATKKIGYAQNLANAAGAINDAVNQIQQNQLKKGEQLSISAQQAQFQRNKALAITNALINGASAVVKGIAEFGPPPSPLGIAAIISAGTITALQVAAIAGKKFEPQKLAEGTPRVRGGVPNKDSVHALLMPDERVVPTKDNLRFWNPLESIRMGRFDREYVKVSDLANAKEQIRLGESGILANSITGSLLGGSSWKGNNIVRELRDMNDDENRRNKQLIKTIVKSSNVSLRKQ